MVKNETVLRVCRARRRQRWLSSVSLDLMRHGEVRPKHRRRCVHSMVLIDEPKDRIGGLSADSKGDCEMRIFILMATVLALALAAYGRPAKQERGRPTAVFVDPPVIDGPEVAINRRPATVIKPPLKGDGWLATTACCTPNLHRDLRIVVDGRRIETAETFAVDWALLKGDRVYEGDGATNEQFYVYGADVFAVADGTVVSVQDGKPDATPNKVITPKTLSDFGGNEVMLEIAPKVYPVYGHLQPGSLRVKVGDTVKVGAPLAKIGNTGPSLGPHLHFGLLNRPDMFTGRSLPFVIDSYTLAGTVDFKASQGDTLAVISNSKQVRSVYPLHGTVQNFP